MLKIPVRILLAVLLVFLLAEGNVRAQTSSYQELQAAYIFNFAKYVSWPGESASFVVGVYGELEIMDFLQKAFSGKKIAGKPVDIKVIESTADMVACHIIYVPESGSKHIRKLKLETEGRSILIVTEEDLIKRGASISFVVQDDRLKFILRPAALSEVGLTASEGLLRLAIIQ